MGQAVKILIVEDEMIIAANISLQLSTLGYEVSGIIPRGEEALLHIKQNQPDIVLMDIQLKGELNGIETAQLMQQDFNQSLERSDLAEQEKIRFQLSFSQAFDQTTYLK